MDKGEAGIVDALEVRLDESEGALQGCCKILWESAESRGKLRQETGSHASWAGDPFSSSGERCLYDSGISGKEGQKLSFVLVGYEPLNNERGLHPLFIVPEWIEQFEKAWVEGLPMDDVGDWLERNVQEKVQYQIHVEIMPDKMMLTPGESETPTIFDQRESSWYWWLKKKVYFWMNPVDFDYPYNYAEPSLPAPVKKES